MDGTAATMLRERMAGKIASQRELGYLFAMVHVTPEERDVTVATGALDDLAVEGVRITPSTMPDMTRLERGFEDHAFFFASWGDVFGLERAKRAKEEAAQAIADKARLKAEKEEAKAERARQRAAKADAKAAAVKAKAKGKTKAAKGKAKATKGKAKAGTPKTPAKTRAKTPAKASIGAKTAIAAEPAAAADPATGSA